MGNKTPRQWSSQQRLVIIVTYDWKTRGGLDALKKEPAMPGESPEMPRDTPFVGSASVTPVV